ncbi:MAG TPA: hypothetical protein VJM14_11835 [Burkholderiales bacterium]|nr:hypothetical protein [Burkholderiales bacterium]
MAKPQPQQQHPTRPTPDPVGPSHDDDATIPDLTPGQKPLPNRKRRHDDPPAPANEGPQ